MELWTEREINSCSLFNTQWLQVRLNETLVATPRRVWQRKKSTATNGQITINDPIKALTIKTRKTENRNNLLQKFKSILRCYVPLTEEDRQWIYLLIIKLALFIKSVTLEVDSFESRFICEKWTTVSYIVMELKFFPRASWRSHQPHSTVSFGARAWKY